MSNRWTLHAMKSLLQQLGIASAVLLAVTTTMPAQAQQATVHSYAIPSEPLGMALNRLALSSDKQILAPPELVRGHTAPALNGRYTLDDALRKLLAGSGLTYEMRGTTTIVITQLSPPATSSPNGAQAPKSRNEPKPAPTQLAPVMVTGSRLPAVAIQGPQEVHIYTSADIARSGQPTVADFLNTLPSVSTVVTEAGFDTTASAETVRLRGLPIGSTLVLMDGRVVEGSASNQYHGNPFDLNTIPLAAVERIEVLPEAASAVYGSDAIGGVVNIILRKNLDGGQFSVTTGRPTEGGYSDTTASFALGKNFSRGNITFIGSYQMRGELTGYERALTANQDYRRFGGPDNRTTACQPGNVYSVDGSNLPGLSSSFAGIPHSGGKLTPSDFTATSGILNKCSNGAQRIVIPATHRGNLIASGHYDFTDTAQAFFRIIYSQVQVSEYFNSNSVSQFPVPADNPFNPFGVPVLVSYAFNGQRHAIYAGTEFFSRILGGLRGRWNDRWDWEIATWQSYDHAHPSETDFDRAALSTAVNNTNPAQSINLFSSSAPASQSVMNRILYNNPASEFSKLQTVNAFIRGTLFDLPSGPVAVVLGGEYDHEVQSAFFPAEHQAAPKAFSRNVRSLFAEVRMPLWAGPKNSQAGDRLALTFAGRYDRYSDFGSRFTPEEGLEFRPTDTLLLRASYGKAFKAPDLTNVYSPVLTSGPFTLGSDPLRGDEIVVAMLESGGNPDIRPQTGTSRTFGVVWSSKEIPNLQVSLTNFRVTQDNRIARPLSSFIVQDPTAYPPSLIVRAPRTPQDIAKGWAGKILLVDARYINFGGLVAQGYDFDVNYKFDSSVGTFSPSLSTTEFYKYESATPGTSLQNRLGYASADAFASRWKGTIALGWAKGLWSARVAGRYLGRYQDYDDARTLGDFWLFDASAQYDFGGALGAANPLLRNAYAALSVVNALDRKPQYSNYFGTGYDPREGDIRGRFVTFILGTRW